MEDIKNKVNQIIEEVTNKAVLASSISGDNKLKDELGISSLQYIVMALKLEENFGTTILSADNISTVITANDLYTLTRNQLEKVS